MKGLSLPINLIVILVIALLVMLAGAAFFAGGFGSGASTMSDSAALQKGCGMWISRGCKNTEIASEIQIEGYYPDGSETKGTLETACTKVGVDCWSYCCGGLSGTSATG